MTGTNHGMTGAVIAVLVKQPALAITFSCFSDFVCDAIPHFGLKKNEKLFDFKFNLILVSDFFVAVSLMIIFGILFPAQKWLIWSCMVAAASPDLMWAYYRLYVEKIKKRKPHYDLLARVHSRIQWSETPKGWFVEAGWFMLMGWIILAQR